MLSGLKRQTYAWPDLAGFRPVPSCSHKKCVSRCTQVTYGLFWILARTLWNRRVAGMAGFDRILAGLPLGSLLLRANVDGRRPFSPLFK